MSVFEALVHRAQSAPKRIVLAEGDDPRIQEGAIAAARRKVARCVLLGDVQSIQSAIDAADVDAGWIEAAAPSHSPALSDYAAEYHQLRQHKGMTLEAAQEAIVNGLAFSAMMVRKGDADGSVAGAVATTADTVRAALQIIGKHPEAKLVSSFFLMLLDQPHHGDRQGAYVFSDSGLVVQPNTEELAEIAIGAAGSFESLTGETPRVAMLSFSTMGSAKHPVVSQVVDALGIAKDRAPDLLIDGELQFDAAFVPDVAASKAPASALGGNANVFVFPNLEAGNIGYKIAQRIGGAEAIGPILQGLRKPANDLSRGCNTDDVFKAIVVTVLQAQAS